MSGGADLPPEGGDRAAPGGPADSGAPAGGGVRVVVLEGAAAGEGRAAARLLARRLGWELLDADDAQPESNRRRIAAGEEPTDADLWPWLERLREVVRAYAATPGGPGHPGGLVLACGRLEPAYRERLRHPRARFVRLDGPSASGGTAGGTIRGEASLPPEEAAARIAARLLGGSDGGGSS